MLVRDANTILYRHEGVSIEIHDIERTVPYYGKWTGAIRPELNWSCEVLDPVAGMIDVTADC